VIEAAPLNSSRTGTAPPAPAVAAAVTGCYPPISMADFVSRAVQRLREGPGFSRNRYFLALSSPEGRRALRIHRHLRSLERELSQGSSATVSREAERVRLMLRGKRSSRTAWLTRAEFRLLCTSPLVRAALGAEAESES
jgi:hypothetical protein